MNLINSSVKTNWVMIGVVAVAAFAFGAGTIWITALQSEPAMIPAATQTQEDQEISPSPTPTSPGVAKSSMTVLSPNGGEILREGETYNILWASDLGVEWVRISLYASNFPEVEKAEVSTAFAVAEISNRELAQRGYMRWTPTQVSSAGLDLANYKYFKVAVEGYSGATSEGQLTGFLGTDVSDAAFSIIF